MIGKRQFGGLVRRLALVCCTAAACSGSAKAPSPIPTSSSVAAFDVEQVPDAKRWTLRTVTIDKDYDHSLRATYTLAVANRSATLNVVHERNGMARLDAWATPWKLISRTTFHGSFTPTADGANLVLQSSSGKTSLSLTCRAGIRRVMAANTTLVPIASQPQDLKPTYCEQAVRGIQTLVWSLPATESVTSLECVRDGDENDAIEKIVNTGPIDFVSNPGIEWAQEQNHCLFGQGYRRLAP